MVQYQLPMGLQDAAYRREGERINKTLGNSESTLAGILRKITKIEAYAGMLEWLARDLETEEALQTGIKETIEHKNQSYVN